MYFSRQHFYASLFKTDSLNSNNCYLQSLTYSGLLAILTISKSIFSTIRLFFRTLLSDCWFCYARHIKWFGFFFEKAFFLFLRAGFAKIIKSLFAFLAFSFEIFWRTLEYFCWILDGCIERLFNRNYIHKNTFLEFSLCRSSLNNNRIRYFRIFFYSTISTIRCPCRNFSLTSHRY